MKDSYKWLSNMMRYIDDLLHVHVTINNTVHLP